MKLESVSISNYRSVGAEPITIPLDRKVCLLVGRNNAGKSGLMRGVQDILQSLADSPLKPVMREVDCHRRNPALAPRFVVRFALEREDALFTFVPEPEFSFTFEWRPGEAPRVVDHTAAQLTTLEHANKFATNFLELKWTSQARAAHFRPKLLPIGEKLLPQFRPAIPRVYLIPEFREIRGGQELVGVPYGVGLRDKLASASQPPLEEELLRVRFRGLQDSLRTLLELEGAQLEFPPNSQDMLFEARDLRLPLSRFGTGVQELILILSGILLTDPGIVLIEEPEIHLHPGLQRRLIAFLTNHEPHRFLISTHSASIINAMAWESDIAALHIADSPDGTRGTLATETRSELRMLHDLGIRASDILQADCVIWVEGPSDRIYLRSWLHAVAPEIVEGRDYVIMFYGGSGLNHLGVNADPTSTDLIALLRINRNSIILIDSDRKQAEAPLQSSKQRMIEECAHSDVLCWVSDGREIENYLQPDLVTDAIEEAFGVAVELEFGQFDKLGTQLRLAAERAGAQLPSYDRNKVEFAKAFTRQFGSGRGSEVLSRRLDEVLRRIRLGRN